MQVAAECLTLVLLLHSSHAHVDAELVRCREHVSAVSPRRADAFSRSEIRRAIETHTKVAAIWTGLTGRNAQDGAQKRSWCRRHPAGCGALIGLGGGFLAGLTADPDALGRGADFTPFGNGVVLGGIGAAAGAAIGGILGRD